MISLASAPALVRDFAATAQEAVVWKLVVAAVV
jgi:hypothetical protein